MAATNIQNGALALVFGVPSVNIAINGGTTLTLGAGMVLNQLTQARIAEEIVTRNADGNTVNVTTYDAGDEVSLVMMPGGATREAAEDVNDTFPRPGGYAALITGTDITHLDAVATSGTIGGVSAASTGKAYRIASATKNTTAQGHVTWNITLRRHEGITSYAPLT